MLIQTKSNVEWDIPVDSLVQQRIHIYKQKYIWITVMVIREKLAAKRAIELISDELISDKYRIMSPGGVIIDSKNDFYVEPRHRCLKCGGYTILERKLRICEKCRAEHQWEKGWQLIRDVHSVPNRGNQINDRKIVKEPDKGLKGGFISHVNNKANAFKMKSVEPDFDAEHRVKNSNQIYRDIDQSRLGLGFYGGAYRWLEYQLVNKKHTKGNLPVVELIATHLEEIDPEIGDDTAQIQGSVLRVSKYNGTMPSSSEYLPIEGLEEEKSKSILYKKICSRCQKDRNLNSEGYCSSCADKFDKKYLKDKMANAVVRNKNTIKVVIKQSNSAYERIIKEELNIRKNNYHE